MNHLLVSYSPLILCYSKVTCVIAQTAVKFIRIGYKDTIPCVSVCACEWIRKNARLEVRWWHRASSTSALHLMFWDSLSPRPRTYWLARLTGSENLLAFTPPYPPILGLQMCTTIPCLCGVMRIQIQFPLPAEQALTNWAISPRLKSPLLW